MTVCYGFEGTRYVRTRHIGECDGSECSGCLPCPENHCDDCRKAHVEPGEQTCPGCIARVRANLRELLTLYASLPEEVEHRGVDSEAANLNGPAADAEAWSYRKAARSLLLGVPMSSLEPDDENHPLEVLGRWVFMLGEDYGDPTDLTLTISRAVDYLDRRLARLAHDAGQDWCLFAAEIRRCKTHLEAVLHDQNMGDRANIGCFDCGSGLERRLTASGFEDHWTCKGCRRRYTYAEYNFALRAALEGRTA